MEERLSELREEYRRGMEEMARLEQRRLELSRTLLRISGAIQVLEELRARDSAAPPEPRMQVVGS
ncbi:MAG TPA: hypothetical protein VHG28_21365 [Longimicrobiaceae bacterium]|nr:hypothetical protein [Longimicrobiaceae bacterium]